MRAVQVPSLTDKKRSWIVSETEEGVECNCPAFDHRKEGVDGCKHIDLVKTADAMILRCFETHGPSGGGLCRQCVVAFMALTMGKVKRNYLSKEEVKQRIAKIRARKGTKHGKGGSRKGQIGDAGGMGSD